MSRSRKELYRLPRQGKVAGVCAGLAEYFGFEVWLVRIVFISGLLLSGSLFLVLYVAGWFILDVKPGNEKLSKNKWEKKFTEGAASKIRSHLESGPIEVKEKVWQAGELPRQAVHDILGKYKGLEKRLQNLETYVTSPEYTVAREINKL
jgi:phage shock protein C